MAERWEPLFAEIKRFVQRVAAYLATNPNDQFYFLCQAEMGTTYFQCFKEPDEELPIRIYPADREMARLAVPAVTIGTIKRAQLELLQRALISGEIDIAFYASAKPGWRLNIPADSFIAGIIGLMAKEGTADVKTT